MSDPLRWLEDGSVRRDLRRDLDRFARAGASFDEEAGLLRLSAALGALPAATVLGASARAGLRAGAAKALAWKLALLCALGAGAGVAVTVGAAGRSHGAFSTAGPAAEANGALASRASTGAPRGSVSLSVAPSDTGLALGRVRAARGRTVELEPRAVASSATPQGSATQKPAVPAPEDGTAANLQELREKAARAVRRGDDDLQRSADLAGTNAPR